MEETQAVEVKDARRFTEEGDRIQPQQKYEIRPRNRWVLIRKVAIEERITHGGVVVPGTEKSQRGRIVATPEGMGLTIGDLVIYTAFPTVLKDLEELTGDDSLDLVREEEIFFVAVPCQE